jgi:diguanylate cyclase (GGDEF)-like protein
MIRTYSLIYNRELERIEEVKEKYKNSKGKSLLIQVFCGILDPIFIENLISTLSAYFPDAVIIGTTTAGEICRGKVYEHSVVVSFSFFEKTGLKAVAVEGTDSRALGMQVRESLVEEDTKVIIAFLDGIKGNGDEFLRGLALDNSQIVVAGGLAGDNGKMEETYVFSGGKVLKHGVVACALLSKDLEVNTHYSFNWVPFGKEFSITKAKDNVVYEIDGRPALDVYVKYFGDEILKHPISAMEIPIAVRRDHHLVARACVGIDKETKSVTYAGDLKEGERFKFSIGDPNLIYESAHATLSFLQKVPVETVFVYSCVARKQLLGSSIEIETKHLNDIAPTNGFFTYGEFYSFKERKEFFNQTKTVLVLSEERKLPSRSIEPKELLEKDSLTFRVTVNFINAMAEELEEINKKLSIVAQTDELTKLANRKKLLEEIEVEIERFKRHNVPFSVIMIDIDFFKKVNDTFGHLTGDRVLQSFAQILKRNIRPFDIAGRFGGEEFVVVVSGAGIEEAKRVAERLRKKVEEYVFEGVGKITASFGVAEYKPGMSVEDLLKSADSALYKAKKLGRNRVVTIE